MTAAEFVSSLHATADKIAQFLADVQLVDGGFPGRTFYGEAYAAALWKMYKPPATEVPEYKYKYAVNMQRAISCLCSREAALVRDPDAHWEFINYGMLRAGSVPFSYAHNNTRVINWQLLLLLTRSLQGDHTTKLESDIRHILRNRQTGDGAIPDFVDCVPPDPDEVIAHQYHNFATCLIGELIEAGHSRFEPMLGRAINYIEKIARANGDVNYMGRGKGQIKGFAVAIYALVQHSHQRIAALTLDHMIRYMRNDEPMALVLTGSELRYNLITDAVQPEGWESYNNYFDYLPLVGYYLKKSAFVAAEM